MKIEDLVQVHYHELNQTELYIWNYIMHHKKECEQISIQKLAGLCNISHTTILRFIRKLGFEGYGEFKYYLRWNENGNEFGEQEVELCCQEVLRNVSLIRDRDCSDIFERIDGARRIFLYGTGEMQVNAAREMKRCFSAINIFSHLIEGIDEIKAVAEHSTEQDLFFVFSMSGENERVLELAEILKAHDARMIAFTYREDNRLGNMSDIHIPLFSHRVQAGKNLTDVHMVSHFSVIAELLFIKYLEYLDKKR